MERSTLNEAQRDLRVTRSDSPHPKAKPEPDQETDDLSPYKRALAIAHSRRLATSWTELAAASWDTTAHKTTTTRSTTQ